MWKKWMALGLCVLSICSYTYVGLALGEQRALAGQMLRLHIVANSDEAADQAEKLRVRDALLPQIAALTRGCHTREEAEAALAPHLDTLAQRAALVLGEDGAPQNVRVLLTTETFPRRDYDTFSLPAGRTIAGMNASLVVDVPVMIVVMWILTIPALVTGRMRRWQGIALLAVYAAFCVFQFVY